MVFIISILGFFIRAVRTYIRRPGTYPTKQHRLLWRRWSTRIMNPGVPPAEECGTGLPSVDFHLAKDGKQILRAPVKLTVPISQNQEYRQPYTGAETSYMFRHIGHQRCHTTVIYEPFIIESPEHVQSKIITEYQVLITSCTQYTQISHKCYFYNLYCKLLCVI